jgi:hypothetical protein
MHVDDVIVGMKSVMEWMKIVMDWLMKMYSVRMDDDVMKASAFLPAHRANALYLTNV